MSDSESEPYSSEAYSEDDDSEHAEEQAPAPPPQRPAPSPPANPHRSPIPGLAQPRTSAAAPSPAAHLARTAQRLELGLTDEQRAVFRERRGRWRQLLAESRLRLAPFAADIYEAVPLDEAALFAAGRGRFGGQRCAETQTGDDREEQDSQTDAILRANGRCQAPHDLREELQKRLKGSAALAQLDAASCLDTAASRPAAAAGGAAGFSAAAGSLAWEPFLQGRPVSCITFAQVGKPLLAATYGCAEQPQTPRDAVLGLSRHDASRAASVLAHAGCVALWDLSSPKTPVAVLLCESSPTCCVWGPPECSHVVLAGSADGSVQAWDLREPDRLCTPCGVAASVLARSPTYSTSHLAPAQSDARSIVALTVTQRSFVADSGSADASFGLFSLSAWGCVTAWTVLSSSEADSLGSDTAADPGLRCGGCVRLVQVSSRIPLAPRVRTFDPAAAASLRCFAMTCPSQDSSHVLVGCDCGSVLKGARFGMPSQPKDYRLTSASALMPSRELRDSSNLLHVTAHGASSSRVIAIDAHPSLPLFLACHESGAIALHSDTQATAVLAWHDVLEPGDLLSALWLPARAGVFVAAGRSGAVRVFDVCKDASWPVAAHQIAGAPLRCASISGGAWAAAAGATALAAGTRDGRVEYHLLVAELSSSCDADLLAFKMLCGLA